MQEEYDALLKNRSWIGTSLPPNTKAIGCKWVLKVKRHPNGSIQKYKARLVAKGFHQKEGLVFDEVFSPVVKPSIVRLTLSIALRSGNWI